MFDDIQKNATSIWGLTHVPTFGDATVFVPAVGDTRLDDVDQIGKDTILNHTTRQYTLFAASLIQLLANLVARIKPKVILETGGEPTSQHQIVINTSVVGFERRWCDTHWNRQGPKKCSELGISQRTRIKSRFNVSARCI